MDGITTTASAVDDRTDEQWIEDQIYELRARKDLRGGFSVYEAGEIAFAKRLLERINQRKARGESA